MFIIPNPLFFNVNFIDKLQEEESVENSVAFARCEFLRLRTSGARISFN